MLQLHRISLIFSEFMICTEIDKDSRFVPLWLRLHIPLGTLYTVLLNARQNLSSNASLKPVNYSLCFQLCFRHHVHSWQINKLKGDYSWEIKIKLQTFNLPITMRYNLCSMLSYAIPHRCRDLVSATSSWVDRRSAPLAPRDQWT